MLLKAENLLTLKDRKIEQAGRKMRTLLVFPPDTHAVRAMYTFQDNDNTGIGVKPPLGPMFVAAYLKKNTEHEVKILDCQVLRLNEAQIKAEIADFKPDIVGVCAWTDFWYDAWRVIQIAKEVDPAIHVTVGGPHVGGPLRRHAIELVHRHRVPQSNVRVQPGAGGHQGASMHRSATLA